MGPDFGKVALVADITIRGQDYVAIGHVEGDMPVYRRLADGYEYAGMNYPSLTKWVWAPDMVLGEARESSVEEIEEKYGVLYADAPEPSWDLDAEPIPLKTWADRFGGEKPVEPPPADNHPDWGW